MTFFNKTQIERIVEIAFAAGKIALDKQNKNLNVTKKLDNSDVSDADIEVSNFIFENLTKYFPKIKIICEEKKLRKFDEETFFLIDPIDGTSSYIKGSDEYSINIALIQNSKPIFGLIYAPKFDGGKLVYTNEENKVVLIHNNKSEILLAKKSPENKIKIITSKRKDFGNLEKFIAQFFQGKEVQVIKMSSAAKFIPVLEHKADMLLTFRDTMEWDIAAGHALLNANNGTLKEITVKNDMFEISKDMIYKKKDFVNNFFIAKNS